MSWFFTLYCVQMMFIIGHFLDSAKEEEWTEPIYKGSYHLWFFSSMIFILLTIIGIPYVYEGTSFGYGWSIFMGLAGLSGYGYHKITHIQETSEVCNNGFSYIIMYILNILSLLLIAVSLYQLL